MCLHPLVFNNVDALQLTLQTISTANATITLSDKEIVQLSTATTSLQVVSSSAKVGTGSKGFSNW